MKSQLEEILQGARSAIEPTSSERKQIDRTYNLVKRRILEKASKLGLNLRVEEVGSVGKDTWIRGEADLDAFIIFPEGTSREDLVKQGLKLGEYASGGKSVVAYAEHPYTRARIDHLDVDIVPCIGVKDASKIVTAVDRTPFHKQYVIRRLNKDLRADIRLLKRFLITIGVYGAEIRVKGFSGYLAELLVIHYDGFEATLKAISNWEEETAIDMEGLYKIPADLHIVFEHDPLIVIDPVDRRRNVAAAVTHENLATLVSASREFLHSPSPFYFKDESIRPGASSVARMIRAHQFSLLGLQVDCPKLVPDVLWGQLYKSLDGMNALLKRFGFTVIHSDVWTDEEEFAVFLFELESLSLPPAAVHQGPSVYMRSEAERFLKKHLDSRLVTSGPWISGNRWLVKRRRSMTSADTLMNKEISQARLGTHIESSIRRHKRVATGEDVIELAGQKADYQVFLENFVRRRPHWLEWKSLQMTKNS